MRMVERYGDADLPLAAFERAQKLGIVADPQSDDAKAKRRLKLGKPPLAHECVSLDTDAAAPDPGSAARNARAEYPPAAAARTSGRMTWTARLPSWTWMTSSP
jgi:hypothetical protein